MAFSLQNNPLFSAPAPEETPAEQQTGKKKRGPAPNPETADFQRATFIVRKDLLKKLHDKAYQDRKNIKEVINEILEDFLKE